MISFDAEPCFPWACPGRSSRQSATPNSSGRDASIVARFVLVHEEHRDFVGVALRRECRIGGLFFVHCRPRRRGVTAFSICPLAIIVLQTWTLSVPRRTVRPLPANENASTGVRPRHSEGPGVVMGHLGICPDEKRPTLWAGVGWILGDRAQVLSHSHKRSDS